MGKIKILAFAGSLRKNSYNKFLLQAASDLSPDTMEISIFDLQDIPLYNMDLEKIGVPAIVNDFRNAIGAADAIILAVPEHNGTISAVMKNAIEWASRRNSAYLAYQDKFTPFYQKPVAIVGASTSHFATIRAQTHLLYLCNLLQMQTMSKPSLMLAHAQNCFDEKGVLIDEDTKKKIRNLLLTFSEWIIYLRD